MRILVRGGVQCPTYVVYSKRAGVIPSPLLSAGSEFVDMKKEIFAWPFNTHTHISEHAKPHSTHLHSALKRGTKKRWQLKKMPTTRCFAKLSFGLSGKLSLRRVAKKNTAFKSHFHFPGTVTFCHFLSIHWLSLAFCLTDAQKSHLFQQIIHYCGHQMWGFSVFA